MVGSRSWPLEECVAATAAMTLRVAEDRGRRGQSSERQRADTELAIRSWHGQASTGRARRLRRLVVASRVAATNRKKKRDNQETWRLHGVSGLLRAGSRRTSELPAGAKRCSEERYWYKVLAMRYAQTKVGVVTSSTRQGRGIRVFAKMGEGVALLR